MEPNNFEKQIKERLDAREIQPSEMAWSKLDAMLTVASPSLSEQPKPKNKFPWMYLAASFVGVLLLSTLFFNNDNNDVIPSKTTVVGVEKKTSNEDERGQLSSVTPKEEVAVQTASTKGMHAIKQNVGLKSLAILQSNSVSENEIAQNKTTEIKEATPITAIEDVQKRTISLSAARLLAEVTNENFQSEANLKSNNSSATSIVVQPDQLLSKAESELNQTFKESAINKFNKNFNAIRTVLVNRNYE
ncbi:hypothetical protein KBJ98_00255 [Flavobacterium sp. F-328]|uniref:Anti-sigma factor n=1 Tax=Flavobacterium erciyesense TaxID=2825842 RepID=A0ABS5CZD5_9FLAO|nr:hypothetical protein [Flavobacterium erciyesense]MBQ0907130.1 hypothetical protein [Flavobacterium erciyesense]